MSVISDNDNGDKESTAEQLPSSPASTALFNGNLDRSNPISFIKNVFDFVASESDYLWKDSAEKEIASIFRAAWEKQKLQEKAKAAEEREVEEAGLPLAEEEDKAVPEVPMKHAQAEEIGGLRAPNSGNGLDLESYSWTQTLQEVTMDVPVPKGTKGKFVVYDVKKNYLKVGLKCQPPIIEGELFQNVKPDDCCWTVEDQSCISILLIKHNQDWWKCVIKGEPEIDTQKVEPESSNLFNSNPEIRQMDEKMTFDQGEKSVDLRTTEEILKPMIQNLMDHYSGSSPPEKFHCKTYQG